MIVFGDGWGNQQNYFRKTFNVKSKSRIYHVRGVRLTQKGYYLSNFYRKLHENEENLGREGEGGLKSLCLTS